ATPTRVWGSSENSRSSYVSWTSCALPITTAKGGRPDTSASLPGELMRERSTRPLRSRISTHDSPRKRSFTVWSAADFGGATAASFGASVFAGSIFEGAGFGASALGGAGLGASTFGGSTL